MNDIWRLVISVLGIVLFALIWIFIIERKMKKEGSGETEHAKMHRLFDDRWKEK